MAPEIVVDFIAPWYLLTGMGMAAILVFAAPQSTWNRYPSITLPVWCLILLIGILIWPLWLYDTAKRVKG